MIGYKSGANISIYIHVLWEKSPQAVTDIIEVRSSRMSLHYSLVLSPLPLAPDMSETLQNWVEVIYAKCSKLIMMILKHAGGSLFSATQMRHLKSVFTILMWITEHYGQFIIKQKVDLDKSLDSIWITLLK